jgi:hypothetical protein
VAYFDSFKTSALWITLAALTVVVCDKTKSRDFAINGAAYMLGKRAGGDSLRKRPTRLWQRDIMKALYKQLSFCFE